MVKIIIFFPVRILLMMEGITSDDIQQKPKGTSFTCNRQFYIFRLWMNISHRLILLNYLFLFRVVCPVVRIVNFVCITSARADPFAIAVFVAFK